MAGGRGKRGVGILGNVGRGLVVLQEGENPADAGQGHFRFPLPEGEEGQEEEAGEEDKDGRWETVYACGERCAYSGGYPFSISGDIRSVPS